LNWGQNFYLAFNLQHFFFLSDAFSSTTQKNDANEMLFPSSVID